MINVACLFHPGVTFYGVDGLVYVIRPGITPLPDTIWAAWLAEHADSSLVLNQQVFAT